MTRVVVQIPKQKVSANREACTHDLLENEEAMNAAGLLREDLEVKYGRSRFDQTTPCRGEVVATPGGWWFVRAEKPASLQSAWVDRSFNGGPMHRIAVVGVGVNAVAGWSFIPDAPRDAAVPLTEAVRAAGAEGRLIIRTLGVDTRTEVNTMMVTMTPWGQARGLVTDPVRRCRNAQWAYSWRESPLSRRVSTGQGAPP